MAAGDNRNDGDGRDGQPAAFRSVAGHGRAAFTVRGSSFVGHVAPVGGVDEADAYIERVAADHPDATHVVPAYRVRVGDDPGGTLLREWSSDAGEPSGSAGRPALNVLVRRELENVAAVVLRHFGGTKLGVGGLARAYARAVSRAVEDAGVAERQPQQWVLIEVDYDDSGTVRGLLESAEVPFDASYDATVRFDVRMPVGEADELVDRVRSATRGRGRVDREPR